MATSLTMKRGVRPVLFTLVVGCRYGGPLAGGRPGEHVVFAQDPYHWAARRVIRLRANAVDTLLAIMRSGVVPGGRDVMGFPPNDTRDPQNPSQ